MTQSMLPAGATAVYNSSGLEYYRHADWLGSSRLVSTPSRTVSGDTSYSPFGVPYAGSGTVAASFTGQNQDTAPSLYDFPAREYGQVVARWPSPDPLDTGAFNLSNPQTLNLYAYVDNEPMGLVDPQGTTACPAGYMETSDNGDETCVPKTDGTPWNGCWSEVMDGVFMGINCGPGVIAGKGNGTYGGSGEGGGRSAYSSPLGSLSTQKFGCPSVPAHPANASIYANAEAAQSLFSGTSIDPLSQFGNRNLYLYTTFHTGGPEDYKDPNSPQYTSFGNFNYGAVCGAMGFSLGYCQNAAGVAHVKLVLERNVESYFGLGRHYRYSGAGVPFLQSPYGDQPADSAEIAAGYLFQANCIN